MRAVKSSARGWLLKGCEGSSEQLPERLLLRHPTQLTSVSQSDDGRGQGAAALDLFSASRTAAFAAALAGTSNS